MTVDPGPGSVPDAADEAAPPGLAARTYNDLAPLVGDPPAGPGIAIHYPAAGYRPSAVTGQHRINSAAVASLICGLAEIPTLGLSALPAIILGTSARQQIRETGERGEASRSQG